MGGSHPNHYIPTFELLKQEISNILENLEKVKYVVNVASEIKVTILSFQCCKKGIHPYVCIAACP